MLTYTITGQNPGQFDKDILTGPTWDLASFAASLCILECHKDRYKPYRIQFFANLDS